MREHSAPHPIDAASIRFVSRSVTREEVAALTAVITATANEQASASTPSDSNRQSAWQRSRSGLRTAIVPGPGMWRGFSG